MNLKEEEGASPATSNDQPNDEAAIAAPETVAAEPDANAAASSPADETDANNQASLLSAITDAVKPKEEPAAEPSTAKSEEEPGKEEVKAADADETKAEPDDSQLPFHNHPRWKEVIAERDALRDPAERYGQVTAFMEQNGLAPEEVSEGFEVMALLKHGDPASLQKALEWFEPRVQALRDALGVDLPADLQDRVDDGSLDAETAAELAETRAKAALSERSEQRRTQQTEEATKAEAARNAGVAMATAVQAWEVQTRKTDPDFAEKAEMVETTVRADMAMNGPPRSPEEAVALARRAHEKVTATFARLKPAPRPKDTRTPAGTSAPTKAQPATMREAIEASLAA